MCLEAPSDDDDVALDCRAMKASALTGAEDERMDDLTCPGPGYKGSNATYAVSPGGC
jgi:hypothetical protein